MVVVAPPQTFSVHSWQGNDLITYHVNKNTVNKRQGETQNSFSKSGISLQRIVLFVVTSKWFNPKQLGCLRIEQHQKIGGSFEHFVFSPLLRDMFPFDDSGQIIATSHDLGPQKVAKEGKSPYFREI